ncbi:MAG: hypothetical protein OEZ34_05575 [Spirochaetia bacterium]|nr:hypothetical protein [Spirochaetia bacterium]
MSKKIIAFLIIHFLITGCDHIAEHFDSHSHENHESSHPGSLSLDNGTKWKSDTSTSERILAMKAITEKYKNKGESLTQSEYKEIHMRLSSEVDALIQGCKMTGPAHDELHIYLGILQNSMKDLKAEDASLSQKAFKDINKQLNLFSDFFE